MDVLADGHALLFVRARSCDLRHGRWLQRDPEGYIDGPNLYEAFGGNAVAAMDPSGLYYKLWSTWENGAEVYWQDICPIGWWAAGRPGAELLLGQYHYVDGQKFVTYRGFVACDPLQPAMYLLPFENLEGWAKQDISLSAYERFVFQNGIPIDRDGRPLKRDLLSGGLTQLFMALQDEPERRFKELANWATTPVGTRTLEMLLCGGVDPITERNMAGREVREHIVRLAQTGAAVYVGGRLLTAETGAMTVTAGRGSARVSRPVRFGPHIKGPLPEEIVSTFRGGGYTQTTLQSALSLYRVYGGKAGEIGPWWSRTAPQGPLQAQMDFALNPQWGNTAQKAIQIRVPPGTVVYEGFAAPQGGLLGGGSQIYIPKVDPAWVVLP